MRNLAPAVRYGADYNDSSIRDVFASGLAPTRLCSCAPADGKSFRQRPGACHDPTNGPSRNAWNSEHEMRHLGSCAEVCAFILLLGLLQCLRSLGDHEDGSCHCSTWHRREPAVRSKFSQEFIEDVTCNFTMADTVGGLS